MTLIALSFGLVKILTQDELPPLGTNLAPIVESSTQWPFWNLMKLSRPWTSVPTGTGLELDSLGNVKSLKPGQTAQTVIYTNGKYPNGTYRLKWEGKGEFEGGPGSKLVPMSDKSASIEVEGQQGIVLHLVRVDKEDPVRNIELTFPDFDEDAEQKLFHPIFLQRMSLYRSLRFTDWGAVNNSPVSSWGSRPVPGSATYASDLGVPYEVMASLANEKSTIPWVNVPHKADDDYVRQMAKLFKSSLRPGTKICVEYSNECWSPDWAQTAWCQEQGLAQKLSADRIEAGLRFYAKRSAEVYGVFESEFGDTGRVQKVLSVPFDDQKSMETILTHDNVGRKADLLAVATYFGKEKPTGLLDEVVEKLETEVSGRVRNRMFELGEIASKNRLTLVAYAGGQALTSSEGDLSKVYDDLNRDPRIAVLLGALLKNWRSAGGVLFMHYNDCAPWTPAGRWGTLEYQNQDPQTSYKNRALIQYALFPDR